MQEQASSSLMRVGIDMIDAAVETCWLDEPARARYILFQAAVLRDKIRPDL